MSRKIIGVTVGTTMNPERFGEHVKNGKSAYELAVEHGFDGTEEAWIASLNGKDGKDGVSGKDGKDGKDGEDGRTPAKGVDYFTEADKAEIVAAVKESLTTEEWKFTLEDGTEVTKVVHVG